MNLASYRTYRVLAVAAVCALLAPSLAIAQPNRAAAEPVEGSVTAKDGVEIKFTYYPSSAGRDAVPVVLLPDFNETRAVMDSLARFLQQPPADEEGRGPVAGSRAVMTVDLRGHGESKSGFDASGAPFEVDAQRLKVGDFQDMVALDLEAIRGFLVDENDAGRLNLNKLCVVGSGMGANLAILWAARDWATPPLINRKQGQDVKAMVLLSPRWNSHGLSLVEPMKFPPVQEAIAVFLAYGSLDPGVAKDCRNIEKTLERRHFRSVPPTIEDSFFVAAPRTKLQGTALLTSREFNLVPDIGAFLEAQVGAKQMPYFVRRTK